MDQTPRNFLSPSKLTMIAALSIVIIGVVVFHRVPFQEIANYDEMIWVGAVQEPGLATLKRIITWDLTWGGTGSRQTGYYAPVSAASIMVDLWLGRGLGSTDAVLKITNLVLHLLNSLAVLWLIRCLGFSLWIAFTVASIFAIHPLQVSTVAWIAERKNLLVGFFSLTGLLCYCRYRQTDKAGFYWGTLAAYCLSLLAKPSAVTFGPCMVITDLFLIDKRLTIRSLWRAAPLLALGFLWTALVTATEGVVADAPPLWDRVLLFPFKTCFLLGKFFFPTGLTLIYPPLGVDASSILLWLPTVVLAVLGILLLAMHRFVPTWSILWGVSFYILNLIPSSGIVPFAGMNELYVADHYQYLAIIGASLVIALGVNDLASRWPAQKALYAKAVFTVTSVLVLSMVSVSLVPIWDNGESLWKDVIAKNPTSGTAHYNYAHYFDDKGRYGEAVANYRKVVALDEDFYQAYNNLGIIMMRQGRLDAAAEYFRKAIDKNPRFGDPHLALAKIRFSQASYSQALEHCRKARLYGADCRPDDLEKAIRDKANESNR
jgi:protein O-mannosyl-transferase